MVSRTAEQRVGLPVLEASWLSLAFIHWRVPVEDVQVLLPDGLSVDEHDGSAWVGLTPFRMVDMRPPGISRITTRSSGGPWIAKMPRLPGLLSAPETNLRTYVRGPDGRDGLWFLSLDIGNPALAATLRAATGAPYHFGRLTVTHEEDTVSYEGSRVGARASYRVKLRLQEEVAPSELEIWLTSRWRAYTRHLGKLLVTPIEHEPWPLQRAGVFHLEEDLTAAVGLHVDGPALVHFSKGVRHVRVGAPRWATRGR